VISSDGRLVGLVTIGKIAESDCQASGEVFKGIPFSRPPGTIDDGDWKRAGRTPFFFDHTDARRFSETLTYNVPVP